MFGEFKDIGEVSTNPFADSPLGREITEEDIYNPKEDDKPLSFDPDVIVYFSGDGNSAAEEIFNTEIDKNSEADSLTDTRELTEEEKQFLKDNLGWTDKQLDKCTIDEDGIIYYRTDREDMEGKTGDNGVKYERKLIDIDGVKIEGVFPVFDSAFDVQLPDELTKESNPKQFKECNEQLKEAIKNDPELRSKFTEEQLQDIEDGVVPEGYVWHHNEEKGKMQLVKVEDHDRTQGGAAHTGGKALWGGSY